jgi:hypothetical protein
MSRPTKRSSLQHLKLQRLGKLCDAFEVDRTGIGNKKDDLVAALCGAKRASLEGILECIPRDELKPICSAHELDDSGEKDILVARLLGRDPAPAASARSVSAPPPAAPPTTVPPPAAPPASPAKKSQGLSDAAYSRIISFIWGIADDCLRDLYVRGKYRDVILPMTVIRRLDAVLEASKQQVLEMKARLDKAGIANQDRALRQAAGQAFYNTSKFTLRDLKNRASQQALKADFEAYLDGFSPNVQEILANFEFRNQIPRLSKADALGTLIEKLLDPSINLESQPGAQRRRVGQAPWPRQPRDGHRLRGAGPPLQRGEQRGGGRALDAPRCRQAHGPADLPADRRQIESGTYLLYDGACGTGGMLTVAEETLKELAEDHGKQVVPTCTARRSTPRPTPSPRPTSCSKAKATRPTTSSAARNTRRSPTMPTPAASSTSCSPTRPTGRAGRATRSGWAARAAQGPALRHRARG